MAVNPLSTPLKTEYKPLGLEAFAQPLSDMQAKFDTVKQEIEATDFALSRLSQDDPRAKDLLKEIETKRDQLAENLMATGNYRQASSKLLELNKTYNKDEETNAIKSNYTTYQEAVKKQKERVDKGEITQKDYDLWDFRAKHSFQGTQYDKNTDTYSSINVHPRMKNMEKELREESLKLAGMAEDQVVEEMQRRGVDAFTTETIQNMRTFRDRDQVAREIEQFLRTSDQYKNWVQEDADYKWYYNANTDPEFKEKYVSSVAGQYDARINAYSEYLKKPETAVAAQKEIDRLKKDKDALVSMANQSYQEGTFDDFAKTLFMDQAEGRFKTTAFGASDIVDMEKLTMDVAEHTDDGRKAKADESLKKLDEIGSIGTNLAANAGEAGTTITSGSSTSTTDENRVINSRRDAFTQLKETSIDDITDIPNKGVDKLNKQDQPIVQGVQEASKDLHVTLQRMNNFNNEIKNRDAEIDLKKETLAKANSPEEKKMITAELNEMYQNKEELRLALADDTRTFDNIIASEINSDYIPEELKKKYETEYQNDPVVFLRNIKNLCNGYLAENLKVPGEVIAAEKEILNQWYKDHPDRALSPEQEQIVINEGMMGKYGFIGPDVPLVKEPSPEVKFAQNIMKAYKWNLSSKFDAIGSEIIMNKNMDVMTDGAVTELKEYVINNSRGKSDVKKVSYNQLTGESKEDSQGNKFDLAVYNETPHFAGTDKNGDVVLRYVLKSDYDPETATAKTAVANYIKSEKGIPETTTYNPTAEEIAAWRGSNPTDLYIAVKGRTKQLTDNAEKNYTEIAEAGLAYKDGEVITQNLNNYAPIHLNANAGRKEGYYKMAARLKDAVDNQHKHTELIQAPAAWKDNGDGTFNAFQITYRVQDGNIMAMINQGTMGKDKKVTWAPLTVKTLDSLGQNLPTALASMDLMYGTGREEDLVHTQRGFDNVIFVPAFEDPGVALQGIGNR
jgi:hypothetical protein